MGFNIYSKMPKEHPSQKIRCDIDCMQKNEVPELNKVFASIKHYMSIAQRLYKPQDEWIKK